MNVFCDYIGHPDLAYSMSLLFKVRLGWKLYFPSPHDPTWADKNFLTPQVPNSTETILDNGSSSVYIKTHDYSIEMITFDRFMSLDINLFAITSRPNEFPMIEIAKSKPNAKIVHHIANIGEVPNVCKNVLLSTKTSMAQGVNWIKFTPEHHARYTPAEITQFKSIRSYFNFMRSYPVEIKSWAAASSALPDFDFRMHGGGPPYDSTHGSVSQDVLHLSMQEAQFIWHTKPAGGCGYTARQALACGKPLIVKLDYSRNYKTLAQDYLVDGVNCIDISPSKRTVEEGMSIIRQWSEPSVYAQKVEDVKRLVKERLDFDAEAIAIKSWIERLS